MTFQIDIAAMTQVGTALEPLDDAARSRVLQWAIAQFLTKGLIPQSIREPSSGIGSSAPGSNSTYDSFAELFEAAAASTEREKALVAAYWVQVNQSQPSFGSQPLNDALKDLGHGVGNITDALTSLKDERPALILQLKKSGSSKQARKTYKLTQEGIRRVQDMINKVPDENASE